MKGYIFRCNDKTKEEVFNRRLFGEEWAYLPLVKQIAPGDFLFLYNTSTFEFSGAYKATSAGDEYIEPDAWQAKFPAQVRFETTEDTTTLPFNRIEKVIKKYRNDIYPYMELTADQVTNILDIILTNHGEKT